MWDVAFKGDDPTRPGHRAFSWTVVMLGRVLGCSVTDHVWGYFKPVLEASCRFLQTRLCDDDWLACPEQYKKRKINFKCFFSSSWKQFHKCHPRQTGSAFGTSTNIVLALSQSQTCGSRIMRVIWDPNRMALAFGFVVYKELACGWIREYARKKWSLVCLGMLTPGSRVSWPVVNLSKINQIISFVCIHNKVHTGNTSFRTLPHRSLVKRGYSFYV